MILRIPIELKTMFISDKRRFLRNIANYAVESLNPYFEDRGKIASAIRVDLKNPVHFERFRQSSQAKIKSFINYFDPYFKCMDQNPRYMHVDLSYSRDLCGIAMCQVMGEKEVVRQSGDQTLTIKAPIIKFDFVAAFKPSSRYKIHIPAIEELIYYLVDNQRFNIALVTFDRWQSISTVQNLVDHGITSTFLSVDRTAYKVLLIKDDPYYKRVSTERNYLAAMESLLNAVNEDRILIPQHPNVDENYEGRNISQFELEARFATQVSDKKVDHPQGKTLDLLQAIAGALFNAETNYFGLDLPPHYDEDSHYAKSDSIYDDFYKELNQTF